MSEKKDAQKKLRKPNWDNYLTDWRNYPYDTTQVEKYRALLHSIIKYMKGKEGVEKDICEGADFFVDALADRAIHFMEAAGRTLKPEHFPEEGYEIIAAFQDEMETIYNYMTSEVGFSDKTAGGNEKRKKTAIEYFEENKKSFKYIIREHLEDNSLYEYGGGQEKRNFKQRLLPVVVKNQGLGKWRQYVLDEVLKFVRDKKKLEEFKRRQS